MHLSGNINFYIVNISNFAETLLTLSKSNLTLIYTHPVEMLLRCLKVFAPVKLI